MSRKLCLSLFGLLAAFFVASAAAAEPQSLISIKFANPAIPDIYVTGVDQAQPYGTWLTPEAQRAHDRALAALPPPDPRLYAWEWESHEAFDVARVQAAAEASTWGPSWCGGVEIPFELRWPTPWMFNIRPTPATAHPVYDTAEYRAELAEWIKARSRQ